MLRNTPIIFGMAQPAAVPARPSVSPTITPSTALRRRFSHAVSYSFPSFASHSTKSLSLRPGICASLRRSAKPSANGSVLKPSAIMPAVPQRTAFEAMPAPFRSLLYAPNAAMYDRISDAPFSTESGTAMSSRHFWMFSAPTPGSKPRASVMPVESAMS